MHKAKCKKKTAFQSVQVKSVFLYGNPNKGKQDVLSRMERQFTDQVNRDIALLLDTNSRFAMQLIKNDKKDSALRQFEKANRLEFCPSAAFCQNAFDVAVTKLSLRLNDIRQDMYRRHQTIFTQSKVLFALALQSARKEVMVQAMMDIANARKTKKEFYLDTAKQLGSMSNAEFSSEIFSFADEYAMASLLFKVPTIRREQVVLDSRMMKLEKSTDTKCSHVLSFSNPFDKGHRITIPINTSRNSIRRIAQYDTASTVFVSLNRHGKLRVQLSLSKEVSKPKVKAICGVDTGIKDCFYCSDGRSIGTMDSVISFYKKTVEPSFGELSSLRNKKRKILYYVRHHKNLNSEVKEYLLAKVDRLHHMTQVAKAPYRRKRHYYQMLNHEVSL